LKRTGDYDPAMGSAGRAGRLGESGLLLLEKTGGFVLICRFTPLSGVRPLLRSSPCAQSRLATKSNVPQPDNQMLVFPSYGRYVFFL